MGGEPGGTSASIHGLGYLFTALRRQGLIADELVLQLATFLGSLDLFLELIVLTPRTLTAYQVRHGGKQGTDNPELSRIHSGESFHFASHFYSARGLKYLALSPAAPSSVMGLEAPRMQLLRAGPPLRVRRAREHERGLLLSPKVRPRRECRAPARLAA